MQEIDSAQFGFYAPRRENGRFHVLVFLNGCFRLDVASTRFRLFSLQRIMRRTRFVQPTRATHADVASILHRLEGTFQRWTWEDKAKTPRSKARKWDVENEYHLQNLLWFCLYPLFPDLKGEEHLPSLGQKQPRVDICIPSLQLIIEAKFMRSTTKPQAMIDEIASDASLYLKSGSAFTKIIPVIWDDCGKVEEHALLKRGLDEITGIVDSVIISRPGKMRV